MQRKSLLALIAVVLVGLVVAVLLWTPDVDETEVVAAPEVAAVVEVPAETELPEIEAPEETRQPAAPKWAGLDADLERFAAKPALEAKEPDDTDTIDAQLWYRFVDGETRLPVAGVELRPVSTRWSLSGEASSTDLPAAMATSDAEGRAGVRNSGGPRILSVIAEGYGPLRLRPHPSHEPGGPPMEIRLMRSATLVVRFEGDGPTPGGEPGVVLSVSGHDLLRPPMEEDQRMLGLGQVSRSRPVGEDGACRIEGLPSSVPIEAKIPELRFELKEALVLAPGEVRDVTWKAAGEGRILGSLVDDRGEPIAGRQLVLMHARGSVQHPMRYLHAVRNDDLVTRERTDAAGRFRFEGIPLGAYYVGPVSGTAIGQAMWDELAPIGHLVVLDDTGPVANVALIADRGLYLEGVVVDPDGDPVPRVQLFMSGFARGLNGRTDTQGEFRIGPVMARAHGLSAFGKDGFASSDIVEVTPGETPVRIQLKRGGVLSGSAVDGSGVPVAAKFSLGGTERFGISSSFRPSGHFEFSGRPADTYTVTAIARDGRIGYRTGLVLGAGESIEDIAILLAPAAMVRAVYEGSSPRFFCDVRVDGGRVGFHVLEQGQSLEILVPAGKVALHPFEGTKELTVQTVEARVGETCEVRIEDQ